MTTECDRRYKGGKGLRERLPSRVRVHKVSLMTTPYIGLLFLMLTGCCWVAVGVVISRAARDRLDMGLIQLCTAAGLFALSLSMLLVSHLFFPGEPVSLRTKLIVAACHLCQGLLNFLMIQLMARAMLKGPNGIIWSIAQSGLVFPFAMGVLCFDVPLSPARGVGLFAITASVLLYGLSRRQTRGAAHSGLWHWFAPALAAMFLCGGNQCLGNIASYLPEGPALGSPYRVLFIQTGTFTAWLAGNLSSGGPSLLPRLRAQPRGKLLACVTGLLAASILSGCFFLYPGLDRVARAGLGAIGYPVAVCTCVIGFLLYSVIGLREKFETLQKIGLVAGLAGIALISMR